MRIFKDKGVVVFWLIWVFILVLIKVIVGIILILIEI